MEDVKTHIHLRETQTHTDRQTEGERGAFRVSSHRSKRQFKQQPSRFMSGNAGRENGTKKQRMRRTKYAVVLKKGIMNF